LSSVGLLLDGPSVQWVWIPPFTVLGTENMRLGTVSDSWLWQRLQVTVLHFVSVPDKWFGAIITICLGWWVKCTLVSMVSSTLSISAIADGETRIPSRNDTSFSQPWPKQLHFRFKIGAVPSLFLWGPGC
jgi:hypothetical protein